MKKLLLSIAAAILLHAAFLSSDFSSLQLFPSASPELKTVTMTLIAYTPPDPRENPTAAARQTADPNISGPVGKPEAILPAPAPDKPPENTAEPPPVEDQAPVMPDTEAATDQSPTPEPDTAAELKPAETTVSKQSPTSSESKVATDITEPPGSVQVWQKPKQSLKALTKVIPRNVAAVPRPAHLQTQKPDMIPQEEVASSRSAVDPQIKPQAAKPAESAAAQDAPSLPAALEDAANAVASVNKQVPAPKIILAKPLYRRNPPPNYPTRAQRRGLEGVVILDVSVNEAGEVKDLTVFQSSGHKILDRAAMNSVKKWLFQPGTRNGQKIETQVRVPVRFQLQ